MKQFVATLLLSGAMLASAFASTTPSSAIQITGYDPGKYHVTTAIEQSLNSNVLALITKNLNGRKGIVVIWVTGSADQTGDSTKNEDLAMNRALAVKSYLSRKLYEEKIDANIIVSTRGDELNSKMVTVDWGIEFSPQTAPQKKGTNLLMLAVGAFILVMLALAFAMWPRKKAPQAEPAESEPSRQELSAIVNGRRRFVVVEVKENDLFVLPFPREKGSTELATRTGRHNAKQGIKKYLADNDPDMQALIAQHMKTGIVREASN